MTLTSQPKQSTPALLIPTQELADCRDDADVVICGCDTAIFSWAAGVNCFADKVYLTTQVDRKLSLNYCRAILTSRTILLKNLKIIDRKNSEIFA